MKAQNVLITGGSGLVGRELTSLFQKKGYQVAWLSRSGKTIQGVRGFQWDIVNQSLDSEAIKWAQIIIHLAGEGVANGRWTDDRKRRILDSRVESTKLLFSSLKESENQVHSFISASAIGYYGLDNGDKLLKEEDVSGSDFLAEVTKKWENEVDRVSELSIKVSKLRISVVLSENGGALEKMSQPVRWGVGAALGSGKQFMSWIHITDLCRMIDHLIDIEASDVYNAATPNPVTNIEMTKAIAHQLDKPLFLPNVPVFVLKLMFGEMADMLLGSSRVSSNKIENEGLEFQYPTLELALENLLR